MNFINRAIKNVTRSISKTVLLTLTFFLIGNLVIVGLGVAKASENAKTLTRQKMRAVVTYELDYRAIDEYAMNIEDADEQEKFYQNYPRITLDEVNSILSDERVKAANVNEISMVYKVDDSIDFVHLNNEAEEYMDEGSGQSCYFDEALGSEVCETYIEPSFAMKANYFPSMIEFEDGNWKIVKGNFYTQKDINEANNVAIISKALAETNNIDIGDSIRISLDQPGSAWLKNAGISDEDIIGELEVVGIYEHDKAITPDNERYAYTYPYENYDNMILVPGTTMNTLRVRMTQIQFDNFAQLYPEEEYYKDPANRPTGDLSEIALSEITILLNDPLVVDDFVKEHSENVKDFTKLNANNKEFDKMSKPLDTLNLYATFIVWLVVINAIVIITLVTALTLKTREYEIGVLLSLGATKLKVIAQFFIELALVALLGFSLSIASGSAIAGKIGEAVLNYQIQEADTEDEDDYFYYESYESIWDSDYTTKVTLEDLTSQYKVSVSPAIIAEIYVLGLGIVALAVVIPSFMIMRFNPKKILMNQN